MEFKIVNDVLINNVDKIRYNKGKKYYDDGYVQEIKYSNEDKILTIIGEVASANSYTNYNSSIKIDLNNKEIIETKCSCEDFKKRSSYGSGVICKHIVASSLYVANLLKSDVISKLKQNTIVVKNNNRIKRNKSFINNELLNYFKSKPREKVKLHKKLEYISEHIISCDFKIGIDKMYVMKNLREFA